MTRSGDEAGAGVPEAIGLALRLLESELATTTVDRLWIFPPLIRGRRERGLLAVSCFDGEGERRRLHTVAYSAERTGTGLVFEPEVREEGSAPAERLPRIIDGVVRRSGHDSGDPREVRVAGDPARLTALLSELDLPEEGSPT